MPSCVLNTCCGCIELRTGCLIIGYLKLIVQIILIAFLGIAVVAGGILAATGENQQAKDDGTIIVALAVVFLLILLFFFAFTIVFLVGVHKNDRSHVKAYLKMYVLWLVVSIGHLFKSFAGKIDAQDIGVTLVLIVLGIYSFMVIRSYYHKMDDNKRLEVAVVYNAA